MPSQPDANMPNQRVAEHWGMMHQGELDVTQAMLSSADTRP